MDEKYRYDADRGQLYFNPHDFKESHEDDLQEENPLLEDEASINYQ